MPMQRCNPGFQGLLTSAVRDYQVVGDIGGHQIQPINPDVPSERMDVFYLHTPEDRPFPGTSVIR